MGILMIWTCIVFILCSAEIAYEIICEEYFNWLLYIVWITLGINIFSIFWR